jgi:hypothetical protein
MFVSLAVEGSEACSNGLGFDSLTVSMFCSGSESETALPSGEVFAVISPVEEPLQIRPDVACRVVPKGSFFARSMMVVQIEAIYAKFSGAQTLARDIILDKMNAKSSSSAMGWIPQTRKYSSTFRSLLEDLG